MTWLRLCQKTLKIVFLVLEVAANDGHDALVCSVVYVTGRGGPLGHVLDMVRFNRSMLEISIMLHASNQVNPIARADLKNPEDKDFVRLFTLAKH
jgi:hypothetical protein